MVRQQNLCVVRHSQQSTIKHPVDRSLQREAVLHYVRASVLN
jgi:hypothetical protein